jgi:cysteine desulfurase
MQQRTRVYFDHAATTPLLEAARAVMQPHLSDGGNSLCGNASSPYEAGRSARMAIDRARTQVAALIGANADEVVFTGGGTESDNWALLGVALRNLRQRGHVIISAIEHHAVLEPAETLRDLGFAIDTARVGANGVLDATEVERLLRPDTLLVSVMAVNNEVGTVQPIAEIGKLTRERGVLLHCDASQAAGKMPLHVDELNVELLTLSGHKFGGPKGVGALYIRRGVKMQSLLRGGGQERGRRAGTENVPGIVGMGAAAQWSRENLDANAAHLTSLRERLESGLRVLDDAQINGEHAPRAPHVTNVTLRGKRAESLALGLDLKGFAVGTGSACASGALEPSHVLAAMGRSREEARAALRISLGVSNTADEVDELVHTLKQLLEKK